MNAKTATPIWQTLEEMEHKQPPMPIQTDNSTAIGVVTNKIQPKAIIIESKKTLRLESFEKTVAVLLRTIKEATGYYIVNPAKLDALEY